MSPRKKRDGALAPWEEDVGYLPYKVTVYEHEGRGRRLYLRWRRDGNWAKASLQRVLRREDGTIDPEVQAWARAQALAKVVELKDGLPAAMKAEAAPLTILAGLAAVTDPATGKYPVKTPHRHEVETALRFAAKVWGRDMCWNALTRADFRKLRRARIQQLRAKGSVGHRGAVITVARVLGVAAWLRTEKLISAEAAIEPRTWQEELLSDWRQLTTATRDPEPARPRYTVDEVRAIMAAAWDHEPRMGLLLALGAELRLGQVARCWRRDLVLERDDAGVLTSGWFQPPSSGKKRAPRVRLTAGQLASVERALTGYLARMEEACEDYPLFPAGPLPGGRSGKALADPARHASASAPSRRTINEWFHEIEALAKVPRLPGRGPYGVRRNHVDEIKKRKISREGLKAAGGWSDSQMPDQIYADQEAEYAAEEAAEMRAQVRGEGA